MPYARRAPDVEFDAMVREFTSLNLSLASMVRLTGRSERSIQRSKKRQNIGGRNLAPLEEREALARSLYEQGYSLERIRKNSHIHRRNLLKMFPDYVPLTPTQRNMVGGKN